MKTLKKTLGLSLLLITFLQSGQILGQRGSHNSNRSVNIERTYNINHISTNHIRHSRYIAPPVYRNTHYRYPYHHRVIRTLPVHHVSITYRGLPYYYHSGVYYTSYNNQYIVVMPPRGFRITVLPIGYMSVYVGPSVYYYHSGVYYIENSNITTTETNGKYEVTQPPIGIVVNEISKDAEQVIIDGKSFYDYNDVLYKKVVDYDGNTTYEVVYSKLNED